MSSNSNQNNDDATQIDPVSVSSTKNKAGFDRGNSIDNRSSAQIAAASKPIESSLVSAKMAVPLAAGLAVGSFVAWGMVSANDATPNQEIVVTDQDENILVIRDDAGNIAELQVNETTFCPNNEMPVIDGRDDNGVTNLTSANGVNDNMSFSEAFGSARSEVGAGGVFYWHGNLYGTYYETEWNGMSEAQKDDYWQDVNHFTDTHQAPTHYVETDTNSTQNAEVEAVIDETPNQESEVHENEQETQNPVSEAQGQTVINPEPTQEPEVVVLETMDENQNGIVEAYLVDTDGDNLADAILADVNEDGVIDAVIADTDGDNVLDIAYSDSDFDGVMDTEQEVNIPLYETPPPEEDTNQFAQNDFDNNADMSDWG